MKTWRWPILLIDHADSFTYTIKAYFDALGCVTRVIAHDDAGLLDLVASGAHVVVLSPGPGHPDDVQTTQALIQAHHRTVPMLGICLGLQCMAQALGGRVVPAQAIMHGKQSLIRHAQVELFANIPRDFSATRYHSWVVAREGLPACFRVLAWVDDGDIMALAHEVYPLFGVQYHPEAVLTEHGYALLHNFLQIRLNLFSRGLKVQLEHSTYIN